jgi:hypothetical protein
MLVPELVIQTKKTNLPPESKAVVNQIKDAVLAATLDPTRDPETKAQFTAAAILAAYEYGRTGILLPEEIERELREEEE